MTNTSSKFKSKSIDFIRSLKGLRIGIKAFSRLYHNLGLFFLENQIWKKSGQQIGHLIGAHMPSEFGTPIRFPRSLSRIDCAAKVLSQPLHKSGIAIDDADGGRKIDSIVPFLGHELSDEPRLSRRRTLITDVKAAFTVQNARKIGKLCFGVFHANSIGYPSNNVHRERLNPANPKGYAIV